MHHDLVLQSMNTWRKFRTYRDVRSRALNTLYWDGILYMSWIIGERASFPYRGALIIAHQSVLSVLNMTVMVAAPASVDSIMPSDSVLIRFHQ